MSVTGIQEAAEAVCGLAKRIVDTGCKLIEDLLGEPCKVAGGMLADQVYSWQLSNRVRIAARASQIIDESKLPREAIPPGFFLTFLDCCKNVAEPELQELWARLLASAVADHSSANTSYVKILEQLSVADAKVLAGVYSSGFRTEYVAFDEKDNVGWHERATSPAGAIAEVQFVLGSEVVSNLLTTGPHLRVLGLIEWKRTPYDPSPFCSAYSIDRTDFGEIFAKACGFYEPTDAG